MIHNRTTQNVFIIHRSPSLPSPMPHSWYHFTHLNTMEVTLLISMQITNHTTLKTVTDPKNNITFIIYYLIIILSM